MNLAINGMGNAGCSLLLRITEQRLKHGDQAKLVAVRELRPIGEIVNEFNAGYYGNPMEPISLRREDLLHYCGQEIAVIPFNDRASWSQFDVEGVVEASGALLTKDDNVALHRHAGGARKVVISALTSDLKEGGVPTFITGLRQNYKDSPPVVDNGSCTTRAVSHILYAFLEKNLPIRSVHINVVHPLTRQPRRQAIFALKTSSIMRADGNLIPRQTSVERGIRKLFGNSIQSVSTTAHESQAFDGSSAVLDLELTDELTSLELNQILLESQIPEVIKCEDSTEVSTLPQNDPHDTVILMSKISRRSNGQWRIPILFDNRYGAACAALRLIKEIL